MSTRRLTKGQRGVLGAAAAVMVAVGVAGAVGTFSNVLAEFGREATAVGVVAAGEGLTLILALTMLGLTLLGQSAPAWVRVGLWIAPLAACGMGLSLAGNVTEAVVYGTTPLGMSGAAEGLGLIARRVVIYTTGVDAEAQRRTADAVQQLAYHQAAAERHPDKDTRSSSLRKSWTLAKKVGVGDHVLGGDLVEVQRVRLREGADAALVSMYAGKPPRKEVSAGRSHSAQDVLRRKFAEMDPAEVIRIAADAHPDMPPGELAELITLHGVPVAALQVAIVLGTRPPEYEVHRPDAPAHQQVSELEPVTLEAAVVEAASTLGPNVKAKEIVAHVARHRRLVVTEPYVRTALSRYAKKEQPETPAKPMEGGYA